MTFHARAWVLAALYCLVPPVLRAQAPRDTSLSAAAVRAARARSNAAIAARDTAALVADASPSYHSVSSRNAHTHGRDGVLSTWRAQFTAHPDVNYVRTPTVVRLFPSWQMAERSRARGWDGGTSPMAAW